MMCVSHSDSAFVPLNANLVQSGETGEEFGKGVRTS
jgi:hypothetical protein